MRIPAADTRLFYTAYNTPRPTTIRGTAAAVWLYGVSTIAIFAKKRKGLVGRRRKKNMRKLHLVNPDTFDEFNYRVKGLPIGIFGMTKEKMSSGMKAMHRRNFSCNKKFLCFEKRCTHWKLTCCENGMNQRNETIIIITPE